MLIKLDKREVMGDIEFLTLDEVKEQYGEKMLEGVKRILRTPSMVRPMAFGVQDKLWINVRFIYYSRLEQWMVAKDELDFLVAMAKEEGLDLGKAE